MPFTTWYAKLWQSLRDGTSIQVTAKDGNPYTVNLVTLVNKMSVGHGGNSINPNDYQLYGEDFNGVPTLSAITVQPTQAFSTADLLVNTAGALVIAEIAVFADTIDGALAHHDVMIRRDLMTPVFNTTPLTNYHVIQRLVNSLLV
jgi:hypothetical protein